MRVRPEVASLGKPPRWNLTVEHLYSCSCNWGCPCSFNAPPTLGNCEAALAWRVVKGTYGGVALDGLKWVLLAVWPAAIHLGNGRGLIFIDVQARGDRRKALEALATSTAGPLAPYVKTMATEPEVRTARIEFLFRGKGSRFGLGKALDVRFEAIRNPVTGKEQAFTGILPGGLFTRREDFYSTKTFRVKVDGFEFSYPGRNAILSTSRWRGS